MDRVIRFIEKITSVIVKSIQKNKKTSVIYISLTILAVSSKLYVYTSQMNRMPSLLLSDALVLAAISYTIYIYTKAIKNDIRLNEVKAAREEAEHASKAKSRFLANMSHEIRTPINAILGMNEMILRECEDESIIEYAYNIEQAGTSLLSLINDILDFSKIESGEMEIVENEYETGPFFNDLKALFSIKAEEKQLRLEFHIDGRIPKRLYGDSLRVKQICSNLLSNAIKYTDNGTVDFSVDWEREKDGTAYIYFKVKDTGRGIKQADINTLFVEFQRSDLKNNNNIEGTGLGLAITKTLVEEMKGYITVESEYHKGTLFTAAILQGVKDYEPLGDYRRYQGIVRKERHGKATYSAPDADLLIVDDAKLNIQVTESLLKNIYIKIDTASSGAECISKCQKKTYNVILMDSRMPQMDGTETLRELKRQRLISNTKVIALTADVMAGSKEQYLKDGFDDYIRKPIRPDQLEEAVYNCLPINLIKPPIQTDTKDDGNSMPSWISKLDFLDIKEGLKMCGGLDNYHAILKSYADYAKEHSEEMEKYIEDGDYENFTTKVHALKSSSKLIGAMQLSEEAYLLEMAGNKQDIRYIADNYKGALGTYKDISARIKEVLSEEEEEHIRKKAGITKADLPMLYKHLKEYVEDFNDEAVGSMLKALGSYNFPGESEQTRYDNLLKAHEAADWEVMSTLLEEF